MSRWRASPLRAAIDRIRLVLEATRMVPLGPDVSGERAENVLTALQAVENVPEIELRLPSLSASLSSGVKCEAVSSG